MMSYLEEIDTRHAGCRQVLASALFIKVVFRCAAKASAGGGRMLPVAVTHAALSTDAKSFRPQKVSVPLCTPE